MVGCTHRKIGFESIRGRLQRNSESGWLAYVPCKLLPARRRAGDWPSKSSTGLPVSLPRFTKNPPLRAFEQNAVPLVVADFDLLTITKRGLDQKFGRCVVTRRIRRKSVNELYRMLNHQRFNFGRPGRNLTQPPSCNIDMMCAPVSKLAAGVFIPPSKFVVPARPTLGFAVVASPTFETPLSAPDQARDSNPTNSERSQSAESDSAVLPQYYRWPS